MKFNIKITTLIILSTFFSGELFASGGATTFNWADEPWEYAESLLTSSAKKRQRELQEAREMRNIKRIVLKYIQDLNADLVRYSLPEQKFLLENQINNLKNRADQDCSFVPVIIACHLEKDLEWIVKHLSLQKKLDEHEKLEESIRSIYEQQVILKVEVLGRGLIKGLQKLEKQNLRTLFQK